MKSFCHTGKHKLQHEGFEYFCKKAKCLNRLLFFYELHDHVNSHSEISDKRVECTILKCK